MIKTTQQIKSEKALRTVFGALCYLVGMGFVLWQLIWWYQNPELTKMQVFQEWWLYDIIVGAVVWLGYKLGDGCVNV